VFRRTPNLISRKHANKFTWENWSGPELLQESKAWAVGIILRWVCVGSGRLRAVGYLWIAANYEPKLQLDMGRDRDRAKETTPNVSAPGESHQFLHFM